MLLFQKRFHEGLVGGTIRLTFRCWAKPKVKPGGRYRCHPIGVLEVEAIDRVRPSAINDEEARLAGFDGRAALLSYLAEVAALAGDPEVYRVRFHHAGDGDRVPLALEAELTEEQASEIVEKLARFDERGADGPWTARTLSLVQKHPRTAASKLALKLGRETAELKADIVKLKKLGLTQSFEVGYEISPRGLAFLAARRGRRRA